MVAHLFAYDPSLGAFDTLNRSNVSSLQSSAKAQSQEGGRMKLGGHVQTMGREVLLIPTQISRTSKAVRSPFLLFTGTLGAMACKGLN